MSKKKLFKCDFCKSDMAVESDKDKIKCICCGKIAYSESKLLLKDRGNK